MIKFTEEGHAYTSTDNSNISWTSVTKLIDKFSQPFDSQQIATNCSNKKKSKWYGMSVKDIQAQWKLSNLYSLEVGNWFHNMMEASVLSCNSIQVDGIDLEIVKPVIIEGEKFAPDQKLKNNHTYPEHFTYLKSAGLCGQSDKVEIINNHVNVLDYKSNKEIKLQSYRRWDTGYQMMLTPFQHLQDCNFVHYSLQLSLYMYMILKHNPQFKPGKITLQHVLFEEQTRDKFDNPIYKKDADGNFFVKDQIFYDVPYMKKECQTLVDYLKNNKK